MAAHKALRLYQALRVALNGAAVLAVAAVLPHQLATEAVAGLFMLAVAGVVAGQLLRLLDAVLAVELQHTLVIHVDIQQILLV